LLFIAGSNPNNPNGLGSDPLIVVVAILGAFVLVFLILIIVCVVKKRNKPSLQTPVQAGQIESPEVRERMLSYPRYLDSQMQQNHHQRPPQIPQMYTSAAKSWDHPMINNPKMGLPLPPTPIEDRGGPYNQPNQHANNAADLSLSTLDSSQNSYNHQYRGGPQQQHYR
jgi:hypothetical protein